MSFDAAVDRIERVRRAGFGGAETLGDEFVAPHAAGRQKVGDRFSPALGEMQIIPLRAGANGLLVASSVAIAFYDIAAKRWFALSDAQAGLYAVLLLLATTLGNVLWGYLGDRYGHKRVVEAGALCTVLAALLAAVSRDPGWGPPAFGAVFVASGLGASALQLATLTFVTDFAPAARRPTYIGLASAGRAPFAIVPPLLAGLLADRFGYGAVFLVAAGLATVGGLLILRGVRDPRMDAAGTALVGGT